jgi:acyl-CoA reductase-like NAD-dependent aldehyde dehydrogenase
VTISVETPVPHADELFIGSRWVTPLGSARAAVVSPATGETVADLADVSMADADRAVAAARTAFDNGPWPRLSLDERREIVSRFAAAMAGRSTAIDHAQALESGMPITTAQGFSAWANMVAQDVIDTSRTAPVVERREIASGPIEIRHEPVGTVLSILTYNGAHVVLALGVVPALLMGNVVICKLPPESRMIGHFLADAAEEAGFPEGVLSVFTAGAEVSRHLVAHEDVDAIHFTGGTEVGAQIASEAGKRIARVTLELGGKSAAIVADDADLDLVVEQFLGGAATFQGQLCTALSRVLVTPARHDELVGKLKAGLEGLKIGDPLDPDTQYGPLSERVCQRAEGFIQRAVADGATVVTGGKRAAQFDRGWYLEPTLLDGVRNDMEVAQKEIFGPVYSVITYEDIDDAISIANDSDYGLAGAVFTRDPDLALDVARRVHVGSFQINASVPCLVAPYGGMKMSGYGRVGGLEGLFDLTDIKVIQLPANG